MRLPFLSSKLPAFLRRPHPRRGQSFLELALILPVLLIMLAGMVEVAIFIGRYLDGLDLTREAARFASVRDPFDPSNSDDIFDCNREDIFNFYYDTACVFSPPKNNVACTNGTDPNDPLTDPFCNGFNPYILLNPATDDVVISVFTISGTLQSGPCAGDRICDVYPKPAGYWALSDHDTDTAHNGNWQKDCQGNIVATQPYFTKAKVESLVDSTTDTSSTQNRGLVTVEFYYCYHQVLNLPIVSDFLPNPMRIHAYTVMPMPAAAPTPTPLP